MAADINYWGIWFVYLIAGAVFYVILHHFTRSTQPSWWSYTLRAMFVALMLTPWYANPEGETMAPALMVATLDLITKGTSEFARALIPLLLAVVVALVVSTSLFFLRKKRLHNNDIG